MNDRTEQIIISLRGLGTSPYRLYTNQEVIDRLKELQAAMARGVFEKTHAENLRDAQESRGLGDVYKRQDRYILPL